MVLARVETKIFVCVFSRKFVFAFLEKSLQKVTKITKVFAKTFAKNDAGNENAVKIRISVGIRILEVEGKQWTNGSG
jgi:hypothetical protein